MKPLSNLPSKPGTLREQCSEANSQNLLFGTTTRITNTIPENHTLIKELWQGTHSMQSLIHGKEINEMQSNQVKACETGKSLR